MSPPHTRSSSSSSSTRSSAFPLFLRHLIRACAVTGPDLTQFQRVLGRIVKPLQ
jgi:hypothetical protein